MLQRIGLQFKIRKMIHCKNKNEQAYKAIVALINQLDKMPPKSNVIDKELLGWVDRTLKGWKTTELSHVKSLSEPGLKKAIEKDIEYKLISVFLVSERPSCFYDCALSLK